MVESGKRAVAGVLILAAVALWGLPARGADPEDLSASKLKNGQVTIPEANTAPADAGYVLRFSDEKAFRIGAGAGAFETPTQTLDRMKRDKQGDLVYSKENDGALCALTKRLTDMGPGKLQDNTKFELPAPRTTLDGTVSHIKEGSVYLLQSTDGNYVLLRVLHRTDTAVTVQYIYQADGGLDFSAPHEVHHDNTAAPAATESTATMTVAPLSQPSPAPGTLPPPALSPPEIAINLGIPPEPTVLMPFLETHLRQRAALIADRIERVKKSSGHATEVRAEALAIDDLRQLRAVEAVPVLIDEIAFLNPYAKPPAGKFSMEEFHPAVGALESLGQPAARAALKAIGDLALTDDQPSSGADATKTAAYKLHLLVDVVAAVEGPDVAAYVLRNQVNNANVPHRENYQAALKELGQ